MKAVVMAGGLGSRLYPLTAECPKPMVSFVNKPVLFHILNLLKQHHIHEVIITVRYLADQIENYFGDGHQLGMEIHYAVEEAPLGTAGSVKNAQKFLDDEPFLVISGDIITDIDLSGLLRFHQQEPSLATLAVKRIKDPKGYGVVVPGSQGYIQQFIEKPPPNQIISNIINAGIYILQPELLDYMVPKQKYDFSHDIFPLLLKQKSALRGYMTQDYWCDMGTIQSYLKATADALTRQVKHIHLGRQLGGGVWTGQDLKIAPDVKLYGPIYLGNGVKIGRGSTIYGPSVISDQAVIGKNSTLKQVVVGQNCLIEDTVELEGAIIPKSTVITNPATVENGKAVTGSGSEEAKGVIPVPLVLSPQPLVPVAM